LNDRFMLDLLHLPAGSLKQLQAIARTVTGRIKIVGAFMALSGCFDSERGGLWDGHKLVIEADSPHCAIAFKEAIQEQLGV
jgi:hypothetical protein